MSVPAFKLEEAGFSRSRVEALAEFMGAQAASKTDLLETEHRLKQDIAAVKSDLLEAEHRLDMRIDAGEHRLKQDIAANKIDLIKWMIGIAFAQIGLVFAIFKLFQH